MPAHQDAPSGDARPKIDHRLPLADTPVRRSEHGVSVRGTFQLLRSASF
jgi:hypothetical protein